MTPFTENDLELYVMGGFDGDVERLEEYIASEPEAQAYVAEQARLEMLARAVGDSATFCSACDDVVAADRCDHCGAAVVAGGYQIDRVLVENAHGRLYLAHDADGQEVALKELAFVQTPDAAALAAFEREAKFLRALQHPAIPRFVSSFREGEGVHMRLYLAQEYIQGVGLDVHLGEHFFTEDECTDIARQVLDVLVYLQSLSPIVVHRDIKPANLIRRDDGSIAVVDFGAALDQGQTQGATTIGTFGYMPIEQMAGIVDSTTDLYALGASLWHLLTRREPWKMLGTEAVDTANVSPEMAAFLSKLTAQQPGDRYPSAAAAREALDNLGSETALAVAEGKEAKKSRKERRKDRHREGRRWSFFGWPLAATAVSIVAIGVGGEIATKAIEADRQRSLSVVSSGEQQRESPTRGTLRVRSEPQASVVIVDRPETCVTPCRLELPPGKYLVKLRGAGMKESLHHVTVGPGESTNLSARLRPSPESDVMGEYQKLYRQVGEQLDSAGLAPNHELVRQYLGINYQSGIIDQSVRDQSVETLKRISSELEERLR